MKLPTSFKSRHKIRDFQLCKMYCNGSSYEEIQDFLVNSSKNKKLTVTRIQQILSENKDFVNANIGWDKSKRLNKLIQIANSTDNKLSKNKDIIDVMKEMRTEMEGDTPLIDQSKHFHVTVNKTDGKYTSKDKSTPRTDERMGSNKALYSSSSRT